VSNISCEKREDEDDEEEKRANKRDTRQRNKRFKEKKKRGCFLLAMTDANCAPEEKKENKNKERTENKNNSEKLYNIDCVLCCDFSFLIFRNFYYLPKHSHYFLQHFLHSFDIQQHKVMDQFVWVLVEFQCLILVQFYVMKNDLHR
jgi:hypothetical protein